MTEPEAPQSGVPSTSAAKGISWWRANGALIGTLLTIIGGTWYLSSVVQRDADFRDVTERTQRELRRVADSAFEVSRSDHDNIMAVHSIGWKLDSALNGLNLIRQRIDLTSSMTEKRLDRLEDHINFLRVQSPHTLGIRIDSDCGGTIALGQ